MDALLWIVLLVPLGFAGAARVAGRHAGPLGALGALAALLPSLAILIAAGAGEGARAGFVWLPAADLELGLRLDGLSAAMSALVAVAGLAALVHARGYFAASVRAPQATAALLAFIAAMQGLVLADNFVTLLVFWELVGALSARLIAYEREDERSVPGAIRAFLTTRTADLGLYAAIAALFAATGSVGFDATRPEGLLGALVGGGLLLAAAGKSAQLPFQTWLSGAMAGPTPVSALLHSATMVAAGVYLLVRAQGLLEGWPLELAAWLGGVTAVAAGAFALAQQDLKLVLASSTTSHLGLMFLAAGAGAPAAAIFHLIGHGAAKAGAFLAAGVFQRRRGGTGLDRLAGVARQERAAFWLFVLSAASIAAVPPLAAFWSKDAVLAAAEHNAGWLILGAVASLLAAAYMLRPALLLWRDGAATAGERPEGHRWMLAGIAILAAGTLALGAIHTPLGKLLDAEVPPPGALSVAITLLATGAGAALILARVRVPAAAAALAERQLLADEGLRSLVQRPVLALSLAADRADRALDRLVDASARGAVSVAHGSDAGERRGIDAAVDGLARSVVRAGDRLPRLQSGQLYEYLRNTVAGVGVLAGLIAIVAIA